MDLWASLVLLIQPLEGPSSSLVPFVNWWWNLLLIPTGPFWADIIVIWWLVLLLPPCSWLESVFGTMVLCLLLWRMPVVKLFRLQVSCVCYQQKGIDAVPGWFVSVLNSAVRLMGMLPLLLPLLLLSRQLGTVYCFPIDSLRPTKTVIYESNCHSLPHWKLWWHWLKVRYVYCFNWWLHVCFIFILTPFVTSIIYAYTQWIWWFCCDNCCCLVSLRSMSS